MTVPLPDYRVKRVGQVCNLCDLERDPSLFCVYVHVW